MYDPRDRAGRRTPRVRSAPLLALLLLGAMGCEAEPEPVVEESALETTPPATTGAVASPTDTFPPAGLSQGEVAVRLREWEVQLSHDTVPPGSTTFRVRNTGTVPHAFEVEGQGIEEETAQIQPGDSAVLSVDLQPGEYTAYCPVEGEVNHRQQGMVTTLYVRERSGGSR